MENHQFERLLHEIVELREHTDARLEELRGGLQELRSDARSWVEDARRHFHVLEENLRSDMQLLAEGLVAVNERIDRVETRLEAKMDERFGETHALIRLTYRDLDGPVTTLEGSAPS
jgi:chromosome segregation ATPase